MLNRSSSVSGQSDSYPLRKAFPPLIVEMVRPGRRIAFRDYRELQCTVGCVDHAARSTSRVVVNHGHDLVVAKQQVARMPIGVDHAFRPPRETELVHRLRRRVVSLEQCLDQPQRASASSPEKLSCEVSVELMLHNPVRTPGVSW